MSAVGACRRFDGAVRPYPRSDTSALLLACSSLHSSELGGVALLAGFLVFLALPRPRRPSSSSAGWRRSSPMSSASSRSCTASPNWRWSSTNGSEPVEIARRRVPRSAAATDRRACSAAGGGARPVRRSRTIIAKRVLDRRVGAVGDRRRICRDGSGRRASR